MSNPRLKTVPDKPNRVRIGRPLASFAKGGLLVTPEVVRYFRENDGELTIPESVAADITTLLCVPPRDRSGSFSPSARGNCPRAQALGFLGAPQALLSAQTYNLFLDGRFRHLRWQALGLAAGFLDMVEVPVPMPAYMAKGSVDGVNTKKRFGFELKGTSMPMAGLDNAFQQVQAAIKDQVVPHRLKATNGKGSKGSWHIGLMWKHYHQVYSYMLQLRANGIPVDRFSLVYEHKATQDWAEYVVEPNQWMEDLCQAELDDLVATTKLRRLPQILPECRVKPEEKCPYAAVCHNPYPHLPPRWEQYMKEPVRLVVKRKKDAVGPEEATPKKRRVRVIRTETF